MSCAAEKELALSLFQQPGVHIHLLGIGGVGMAALAYQLAQRNCHVTGCDLSANRNVQWLKDQGIPIYKGHASSHLEHSIDGIVRSTAIPEDNEELRIARQMGIPIIRRGPALAALLSFFDQSIAVSGTHGKTTTTAMIVHLFLTCGQPSSFCVGGEVRESGCVAGCDVDTSIVVEADESDGTLVCYHPSMAVITNIEYDHMEHFDSEEDLFECYRTFVSHACDHVIYCIDSPLADDICHGDRSISYGFSRDAQWQAEIISQNKQTTEFSVYHNAECVDTFKVSVPGPHNVLNALAAIIVAHTHGLPWSAIKAALKQFQPVKRRFEMVVQTLDMMVVSDYAHHPTEIKALIQTATLQGRKRCIAVFQPHRYTRTRALGADFPEAFEGVDTLIITPVYAASEEPLPGGTSADLIAQFKMQGQPVPVAATSLKDAWKKVQAIVEPGDLLLLIGAGDIEQMVEWAREQWG